MAYCLLLPFSHNLCERLRDGDLFIFLPEPSVDEASAQLSVPHMSRADDIAFRNGSTGDTARFVAQTARLGEDLETSKVCCPRDRAR